MILLINHGKILFELFALLASSWKHLHFLVFTLRVHSRIDSGEGPRLRGRGWLRAGTGRGPAGPPPPSRGRTRSSGGRRRGSGRCPWPRRSSYHLQQVGAMGYILSATDIDKLKY